MPIEVEGMTYYPAADLVLDLDVTRQTLWRWRQDGRVPAGRRYRDKQVLFTKAEAEEVRKYANRIEPIGEHLGQDLVLSKREEANDAK